jgi:hypothetical protein
MISAFDTQIPPFKGLKPFFLLSYTLELGPSQVNGGKNTKNPTKYSGILVESMFGKP